jgi:flagellar assembly protein FliH
MTDPTHADEEQAQPWDFPFVEDSSVKPQSSTNAYNKRSDWKYEPPEEVEEILPPTAQEIEEIRAAAFQEGYKEGHHQGLAEGLEEGRKTGYDEGLETGSKEGLEQGLATGEEQIQQTIGAWQALLDSIHHPVAQVETQLESELVNLAVSLARSVIRAETVTNKDIIFQALSEGLKVLPIQESQYQVHLHPDDIVLIKQHFDQAEIDKHNWLFVEAPQMSRGGCDITTVANAVDVTVERRCRDVLDKFLLDQGYDTVEPED